MIKEDLTGMTFNYWTVLKDRSDATGQKCLCKCICGTEREIYRSHLKHGASKSCGCKTHLQDLTGKHFGMWTVICRSENKNGQTMWKCKCKCGTVRDVNAGRLKDGTSTSCGCWKTQDLTGQRIGEWTVLEKSSRVRPNNHTCTTYKCKCSCGSIRNVDANSLIQGISLSCGCVNSRGNKTISMFLNHMHINYTTEYSFKDLVGKNSGWPLRFDFAVFNDNNELLGVIEYQGKQHYIEGKFGQAQREETDEIKKEYCLKHNIKLYEIKFEDNIALRLKEILIMMHANPVLSVPTNESATTIS